MPSRGVRSLSAVVLTGFLLGAGGCGGGQESGTQVQVDKAKEAAVLKSMEEYMMKNGNMKRKGKSTR